jgi:hypothetical protein
MTMTDPKVEALPAQTLWVGLTQTMLIGLQLYQVQLNKQISRRREEELVLLLLKQGSYENIRAKHTFH